MTKTGNVTDAPAAADSLEALRTGLAGLYTRRRLWAVMGVQALVMLTLVCTSWYAVPDSALYMGLGRSLAEGAGYVFNHESNVMVPPLWPVCLAGVTALAPGSYLALNIVQIVLALACTPMAFGLLRRTVGADLALLGAGLFALSFALWSATAKPISDVLFTLLALAAMWAATWAAAGGPRRWRGVAVAGAAIAVATLTRVNGLVIAPAAAAGIWLGWRDRGRVYRLAAGAAVMVLAAGPLAAWKVYIQAQAGTGGDQNITYANAALQRAGGTILGLVRVVANNLAIEIPMEISNLSVGVSDVPPGVNLLIPAMVLIGAAVCVRRRLAVGPASLITMIALLCVVPGVRMRYLLFLMPALIVYLAIGVTAVVRRLRGDSVQRGALVKGVAIATMLLAVVHVAHATAKSIRHRREQTPGQGRIARKQGWFAACRYILDHDPGLAAGGRPEAVILAGEHSVVHYLTRAKTLGTTMWQDATVENYRRRIERYRPTYLVSDKGDENLKTVLEALTAAGGRAVKVDDAGLGTRVTLWRIHYQSPTTTSKPVAKASPAGNAS